jgi:hypothetical protein
MFCTYCAAEKEVLCNYSKNRLEIGQMAMLDTRWCCRVFLSTTGFHPLTAVVVRDGERDGLMAWVGEEEV